MGIRLASIRRVEARVNGSSSSFISQYGLCLLHPPNLLSLNLYLILTNEAKYFMTYLKKN